MGIFDKLGESKDITLTPKSAFALAAMTVIAADGSIEEEEMATLRRILRGDENAFDQAYKIYKDRSIEDCVLLINSALDQKQKLAVIVNLLDITMADGMLAGAEKNLLMAYCKNFNIPDELLNNIVDVIAMKNDFSIF